MSQETIRLLLVGLRTTLLLTAASGLLALVVGTILGVMRISPNALLREVAAGYVEFFRNIPLLTVLLFIYIGLPRGANITLSPFLCGVVGLGLYTAAYVAEILRTGIDAVSRGQLEAARSLGLSFGQMVQLVLLPQAFRVAVPPLGTLLIAMLKNTSVASAITVPDLIYQAGFIEGRTFDPNIFVIVGVIYVAINIPLGLLVNFVERRLQIVR
jgi:His/Glu/Gln/Arg/opine family amino acid ABC transporter permease subunit